MNTCAKLLAFLFAAFLAASMLRPSATGAPADSGSAPPRKPQSGPAATGPAATRPAATPQGTNFLSRLEETFKQRKATLGPDHLDTLAAMRSLAMAYLTTGRNADALALSEETFKLSKTKLGAEHPDTISAMSTLAQAQIASKQYTNAEPLLRQILKTTRQGGTASANSRPLADSLLGLGECLMRQDKAVEAEPLLREGLPLIEKHQPGLSPTFTAQTLLGWALLTQKKFAEAEPLLLKGYSGLKERDAKRPSPSRAPAIREAGQHIVQLYEAWGKPEQAAEWKKRVAGGSGQ